MQKARLLIFIALAGALVAGLAHADSQPEQLRLISSSATGTVEATPDIAIMSGRIIEESQEAEEAIRLAQRKLDTVIRYLKQQRINPDDIRAAQVLVAPKWHYPRNQPRQLSGYEASANFTIKLRDVGLLAGLYSGLINAGAGELQPTQFDFSNRDALELDAIAAAVQRAREKALAALRPLGNKVGEVQNLNINTHWQPAPIMRREAVAMMGVASDAGAAEVNIGNHTIEAQVNASFRIE
ncbi:MAG: SIMPL domain-containing protein [Gammaproteobacteria bacterium]|nr:SIMPL domain-containing protein [Gammaproteobacteria bacterium]